MTTKQEIFVVGGGGHAKVLLHVLSRLPHFQVLGYVDPRDCGSVIGFSRLGGDEVLPELARRGAAAAIGVGKVKAHRDRMKIFEKLISFGIKLPVIVAPSALVAANTSLGEGTVVMDGAIVQPGCVTGKGCIVNTGAILDHDCVLGDDVHVATGAMLSGHVSVGSGSLVGTGACVIQLVRIGDNCTLGAGAAVTEDCMESGVYIGVPAKKVRA